MARDIRRNLMLLSANYSRRPVDWRWQRVLELRAATPGRNIDNLGTVGRYGDPITYQLMRYMAERDAGLTPEELYDTYPEIYEAELLHSEAMTPRWRLEAFVVGDIPIPRIAELMCLTEDVVHTYEQLFFDVRTRLNSVAWVIDEVIGGVEQPGWSDAHAYKLWKLLGYMGRKHGQAEQILSAITMDLGPQDQPTAKRILKMINSKVMSKGLIASMNAPATGEMLTTVLEAIGSARKITLETKKFHLERKKHKDNLELKRETTSAITGAVTDSVSELCDRLNMGIIDLQAENKPIVIEPRVDEDLVKRLTEFGVEMPDTDKGDK